MPRRSSVAYPSYVGVYSADNIRNVVQLDLCVAASFSVQSVAMLKNAVQPAAIKATDEPGVEVTLLKRQ